MLSLPLIAAPMPDVTNGAMARKLSDLGSFGWIHRFQSEDAMRVEVYGEKYRVSHSFGLALPVNPREAWEIVSWAYNGFGVKIFCIDTANGANQMVKEIIQKLKKMSPEIFIVAGNVASWENFNHLVEWGADAIRVGIAAGSVCETRTETGVYSPMAGVIQDIINYLGPHDKGAFLIADGGIKSPAEMCKALALGADLVMAGGI